MNERIQQIAEQAGYHPDVFDMCKPGMEKFAELIVRECMSISSESMTNDNWPPHVIAKHFGVEE